MFPLYDTIPSSSKPWITIGLIGANVLVFLYQVLLPEAAMEQFLHRFAFFPAAFFEAPLLSWERWQPVLTSMFLHGGFAHILGNMWYLWLFGDNVEDALGHGRFLLFYLLCGIAAAIAHAVTNPGSMIPTVGASGAISGVMGAYLLFFPHSRIITIVPLFITLLSLEVPAFLFLGFWVVLQLYNGMLLSAENMGGVAWWAHVGGFFAGMLLGPLFRRRRTWRAYV
ncbi:Rhomboid protease GluP [bacterium HR21]|jgi:membrane associated rhomboid family serine protease|nr:Rhomboid protease GluP [bacterium HR21]